jgi:hypothetical protein
MPRLSATCRVLDCGRVHHAKGYCLRHYLILRRKETNGKATVTARLRGGDAA